MTQPQRARPSDSQPPRAARGHGVVSPRITTGSFPSPRPGRDLPPRMTTDARMRRPSSLPRKLLLGRLVRGGGLLGVAGLAALGVVQVARWVEASDALPLRTISVQASPCDGCTSALREDEILLYAGVKTGVPLFAVELDEVAARVMEHPYVASAAVRRVPPDGLEIAVEARTPAAVLAGERLYLLDASGTVMKTAIPGDGLDLPLITGIDSESVAAGAALPTLSAAVGLLEAHRRAGSPGGKASEVNWISGVGFELVLEDGARVRVGDDGPDVMDAKLARLDAVVRRLSSEGRRASFIYLDDERRPERAAVRLRTVAETPPAGG